MRTVRLEVPRKADDRPLAIVEHDGFQWLVTEVDTANGVTVLERSVPEEALPTGRVVAPGPRFTTPVLVAVCAVFLFLALCAQLGTKLTFSDVVGCIVGFVVLVLLLDRRERVEVTVEEPRSPGEHWWWVL
jgi:hypothetical protein